MQRIWAEVDHYLGDLLAPHDAGLAHAIKANQDAGLPSIDVPSLLGKFLDLTIRISGARRVLEIGTLGGYSTIWMARALLEGGKVITLELEPRHAEIARANFESAGVSNRIEIRLGPALDSLRAIHQEGSAPFDLIFIDADKQSMPEYLDWSLKLSHPGTVMIADNVVRDGKVLNTKTRDPHVRGVQRFLELVAANPRLSATAIPTVGERGFDGFALAVVLP
ncbi:MAG TPA: O-methyltransferase [Terracidiphilus sp.]|nr:O-methyltransferase [Terracidiphilus sp.]